MRLLALTFFTCFACLSIVPRSALASRYFFEFGGGLSRLGSSQALFNQSSPVSLGFGNLYQFTFAIRTASEPVGIHLGLQHRIHLASQGATSYGMQSLYPIVELDFYRAYVNLGCTPLVWKRARRGSGFDFYNHHSGLGLLAEVGVSFPITFEIAFNLAGSAESVTQAGNLSPIIAGTASFRLFFGHNRDAGSVSSEPRVRGDYKGYRYPYGVELK